MAIGILVVCGSRKDRDSLAELVSSLDYWPICPSSPESLKASPPADVALLDLDNCSPDGWLEGLAGCKTRNQRMQILALGTRSLSEAEWLTREYRIRTVIPKPVERKYLGRVLEDIARSVREREVREALSRAQGQAYTFDRIIGADDGLQDVIRTARRVAASDATSVLILGESGTGKELFARAIHGESGRKDCPFIDVNCAAIPSHLLESELFGHEKGAFTDARSQKMGLFQMADSGTIFLDEIGEMSAYLQAKLLKFLDSKKIRRISGRETIDVDARIIAATNRDLYALSKEGRFRQDLYYRLNVVQLHIPPLRKRREDIMVLAGHFVEKFSAKFGKGPVSIHPKVQKVLESYLWPGNVRELENLIERAILLDQKGVIEPGDLPISGSSDSKQFDLERLTDFRVVFPSEGISLEMVEKKLVEAALDAAKCNVTEAARLLRVGRGKLRTLIRRHAIDVRNLTGRPGEKLTEWLVGATDGNSLSDTD
jgi:DNA-binding NtrC family response regulator